MVLIHHIQVKLFQIEQCKLNLKQFHVALIKKSPAFAKTISLYLCRYFSLIIPQYNLYTLVNNTKILLISVLKYQIIESLSYKIQKKNLN